MESLTDGQAVVNTEVWDALKSYLRFSIRELAKPGALRFKRTALADVAQRGTASIYWGCAVTFLPEHPDTIIEPAMIQTAAAAMLAEVGQ